MENKNKIIKLTLLITILISMLAINTKSYAGVSVSQSSLSVNAGQSKTISLSASNATGTVTVSSSNLAVATVSADNWIEDGKSIPIVITGKSEGSAIITVSGVVSDNNGQEDSNYSKTINVTVVNSSSNQTNQTNPTNTEKSNIATLSNLGIKPNDFSGFSPTKTSYSATVPNEVESVEVYAGKGQNGQKISGTGTKKLAEGANTVNVVVTAEDGKTTKTYTINITRSTADEDEKEDEEDAKEEKQEETENADKVFGLKELTIGGLELQPQFKSDIYEYRIELNEDLEKLDLSALATEEDASVEITGNENLQEGENIITIIVKSKDEEQTTAYQIVVNKVLNSEENTSNQDQQEKIIIMAAVGGVILIIIIIVIVVAVKKRRKASDSSIPYFNLLDNPDLEELDNAYQKNDVEDEAYNEKTKKKKHSKGKRFK